MLFFDLVVYEIMLLKKNKFVFPRDKRKFTDNHIIDM